MSAWNLRHVVIVALAVSLSGCLDLCGNEVKSEVSSPDQRKRAVVFERSCGATTPFSTHVSILDRGEALPHSAGNAFAADGDHGAVKDMSVTVRWLSPKALVIRYPALASVYHNETAAKGVTIAYETTQ